MSTSAKVPNSTTDPLRTVDCYHSGNVLEGLPNEPTSASPPVTTGSLNTSRPRATPKTNSRKRKSDGPQRGRARNVGNRGGATVARGGARASTQRNNTSDYVVSRCTCDETGREVKLLRDEVSQRMDEVIRNQQRDYEAEELRKQEEKIWRDALLREIVLARRQFQGSESQSLSGSDQEKADAAKDYVRLLTCLGFLSDENGQDIFAGVSESALEDSKLVFKAAFVVLDCDSTPQQANEFLNRFVKVRKNNKDVTQRIGVYIASGMNRAQDQVRDAAVNGFISGGREDVAELHIIEDKESRREDVRQAAMAILRRGNMITCPTFERAWRKSCVAAKDAAISNALSSRANIVELIPDASLPSPPNACDEDILKLNIYSAGFLIMKVLKKIEALASVKKRCYRTSHEPFWAKHTLELHAELKKAKGINLDPPAPSENVGIDLVSCPVRWGLLTIPDILNSAEVAALNKKTLI